MWISLIVKKIFLNPKVLGEEEFFHQRYRLPIERYGDIASLKDLGAPFGYASSKLSLNFYSKLLANRVAEYNVKVNNIVPGNIYFKSGNWDKKIKKNSKKIKKMINNKVPLRRFGKPEEIADLTTFLLSSKSGFITGSEIVIDGGQIIK